MALTHSSVALIVYLTAVVIALLGFINSPVALILGFVFSLLFTNPLPNATKKGIKQLLKIAVIGLGFGIVFKEAVQTNVDGFALLTSSVLLTVAAGLGLAKLMGLSRSLGFLLTSGTAICGGSAIAAVAPAIRAKNNIITVSLAIVFSLNALALLVFPSIGKMLDLSQAQFGLWAAVAIHDTSSVIGAAMSYGDEALAIATTLKLSRTLWIIPLAIFAAIIFKNKGQKIAIPYFIGGFLFAIGVNSLSLLPAEFTESVVLIAKRLLVVTLFLIGTTLSITDLKTVGWKPLVFALILWGAVSLGSLLCILNLLK